VVCAVPPHTPHNPPERLLKKYTQPGRATDVAKYYAMCEWFDETCGELLGYLDKKKLTKNTVVIYICDNGWVAKSENSNDPNQKLWKGYALRSKAHHTKTASARRSWFHGQGEWLRLARRI